MTRLILVLVLSVFLGACAGYTDTTKQRMERLPQHYAQFDVLMAWETKVVGGKTLVEGVVRNVRYFAMYDLEITVAVLDEAGKTAARASTFVIPQQLGMNETADFSVRLPVAVEPGTKLRFTYQYRGSDGGDDDHFGARGTRWFQTFDATVPAL